MQHTDQSGHWATNCDFFLMASSRPLQRKSIRGQKGTILTEVVVIQGKVDGSYQSSRSIPSDEELEGLIEVHSKQLQICKAQGSELLKAVEILEPANFSLVLSITSFHTIQGLIVCCRGIA